MLRRHISLAERFEGLVRGDERFAMPIKSNFGLRVFCLAAGNEATDVLAERLAARQDIYIGGTKIHGTSYIRFSIDSQYVEERHIDRAWEIIQEETEAVLKATN
jgi:hypothetical protein